LKEFQIHDLAPVKVDLIYRRICELEKELQLLNIPLIVRLAHSVKSVPLIVKQIVEDYQVSLVCYNKEYEVNEQKRDAKVEELLVSIGTGKRKQGHIAVHSFHSQLMMPECLSLRTQTGNIFRVFTPFKNAWIQSFGQVKPQMQERAKRDSMPSIRETLSLADLDRVVKEQFPIPEKLLTTVRQDWPADTSSIDKAFQSFLKERGRDYGVKRDFPGINGTSKMSPYLAIGAVSPLALLMGALDAGGNLYAADGLAKWMVELIWREFYRYILYHFPKVCKHQTFQENADIEWSYDENIFKLWCEGKTGFPIVDAAMRQLKETGWMHNRLRMITSMFLTKDLLIDWRWGEKYFMNNLIDGDLASNNGGWQWSASTGVDSQPYFRVFNPLLQSEKFDKSGAFIKKFVPELRNVGGSAIHDPFGKLSRTAFEQLGYPKPIVDHKSARTKCIEMFQKKQNKSI
jgi:deoxyribodipyrimidine photo-lyase